MVKADVQQCPLFIPTQRAVNYAEQTRRHRQPGVNGERKQSPGSFPFSSQLTSRTFQRISGGDCRGDSSAPTCPALLLPSPVSGSTVCNREKPSIPQPVPDGCILLARWIQRGRGAAQESPEDLQIAHDVYFTSCKTFCRGFICTRWLK